MQTEPDLFVSFTDVDAVSADGLAGDLADSLSDDLPAATVGRVRDDPLTQDFGASLAIILGTSATTAVARGVAKWLARRQDARLLLRRRTSGGDQLELLIDGQPGTQTERIVAEFLAK